MSENAAISERTMPTGRPNLSGLISGERVPASVRVAVGLGCVAFLTYALLAPNPWWMFGASAGSTVQESLSDKAQHFIAYAGLSMILMWCGARLSGKRRGTLLALSLLHGVVLEWSQQFCPPRTTDFFDAVANFSGALCGMLGGLWLRRSAMGQNAPAVESRGRVAAGTPVAPSRDSTVSQWGSRQQARLATIAQTGLKRSELAAGEKPEKPARELNFRFLGILAVAGVVLFGSVMAIHAWQVKRNATSLLELGRKARAAGDEKKAESYFGRYVGMVPHDPNALADLGLLLDRDEKSFGQTRRVYMLFEEVLRTDPSREDIRRRQVETAIAIGRFPDALNHVLLLRQKYPNDGQLDYEAARCHEALADVPSAIEAYEAAIGHAPEIVDAWIHLARLNLESLGRAERSDELLQELVRRNGSSVAARVARGRFYLETKRLELAVDDLQHALAIDADDATVFELAAEVGYEQAQRAQTVGKVRQAERIVADTRQLLKRGLELFPDRFDFKLHLVMLESHFGKPERALAMLGELTTQRPADARAQLLMADLTIERGDFERAREAIERLPSTPASDSMRLFLQGRISMWEERWEDATVELGEARRFLVNSPEMLERTDLALARCHFQLGLLNAEMQDYREVLAYHPNSVAGRVGLAAALLRTEQLPAAIAEYRPLAMIPQIRLLLARLLIVYNRKIPELAQDWREAGELLDTAMEEGDDPAQVTLLRAELLAAQGKRLEAETLLREARTTQADRLEFLVALAQLAEQSGDSRQSSLFMGEALAAIGNPQEAEMLLKQAVAVDDSNTAAVQTLIQFYMQQDRRDDALKLFRERSAQMSRCGLARTYQFFGDLGRAVQSYQDELALVPGSVPALDGLSELLLRNGYAERARPLLERLVDSERGSGGAKARRELAVVLAESRDHRQFQRALDLIASNRESDRPLTVQDRRALALVLAASAQQNDQLKAVTLFEELDDQGQLGARERWLLSDLYRRLGRSDQAAAQLELAVEVSEDPLLLVRLADELVSLGQLDRAAEISQRLTAVVGEAADDELPTPARVGALRVALRLQVVRGQERSALGELDSFAARPSGSQAARIGRLNAAIEISATLADQTQSRVLDEAAGRYLQEIVGVDPGQVSQLVVWLISRDRDVEAFEQLDVLWKVLPVEQAAGLSMAMLSSGATEERTSAVARHFTVARQKAPENANLVVMQADLSSLRGEYGEALTVYRNVLDADRENVLALNNAAWLLAMQRRDSNEAFSLIERAIAVAGELPHLRDTRGCVRLALGQPRLAIDDLEASVAESPQPTTLLHLAAALVRQGEPAKAQRVFDEALASGLRGDRVHPLDRALLEDVASTLQASR